MIALVCALLLIDPIKKKKTAEFGLAFLVSLILPKSLGYYFARQFLTANDPKKRERFAALWHHPHFQSVLCGGTIFWGLLLMGEFVQGAPSNTCGRSEDLSSACEEDRLYL